MNKFDWLSLDEDEEVLWSGRPKIQKIIGIRITDYVVTSEGLYRKNGIFSRSVQKIGFEKVQNISFSQGILGKKFGYGNIEISTAGGSGIEMRFMSIEDPREVQSLINKRIKHEKGETSGKEINQTELLQNILKEIKEINSKIEK
jgi:uncharacterized membrane protein YdbT with pleckstrin-like domain